MKKSILVPNLAIGSAVVMFTGMFFFLKNVSVESYTALLFAALILIAVDAMQIVCHPIAVLIWAAILSVVAMVLTQMSFGIYILMLLSVGISVLLQRLSSRAKNHILADALMLKVWGLIPYIFISSFGGAWRAFTIFGIGLIATLPIALIKLIEDVRQESHRTAVTE